MKRIIIGRGIDCDIVIPDEKDNVSRHHLVISFGVFGKMTISDTSSNGTLDWSLVKDPYVATRRILLGVAIFCVLALIGVGAWYYYKSSQPKADDNVEISVSKEKEQDDVWTKDSTNKIAPKDDTVKMDGLKKASPKKKNTKKASRSAKNKNNNRNVEKITGKKATTENVKMKNVSSDKMPIVN